ncbi:two-component system sensor histidine kinase SenX3 [Trueperella bonasi]|uniref:Sensor-like histidine kinase SenX3 n=1 Tax=Trueperella bonasi TaxID=312286 RepID=A0ABT9NFW3_9ACTO|nr:ATP-binding protein [Trueperella bonasi]MDP9806219.1 two-component system sensor histidine kinase SenX3 [Trueperella bonasi]
MTDGVAFGLGILIGITVAGVALIAYWMSQRMWGQADEPDSASADDTNVTALLMALPQSHIVLDSDKSVLRASSISFAYNLVRNGQLREELCELVDAARHEGGIADLELRMSRQHENATDLRLWVRATPLSGDKTLILFEDNTEKKRLEETRRDFVANVSHELKTPVGAIGLLAEAINEVADEPDNVRRFSEKLTTESHRLADLVQEIIQLSRLQDADVLEDSEFVAVDDVVLEALDRVRVEADDRGVRLFSGGEKGLYVYGNRSLLTTAVRNLLDNAVRYSRPHGQVSVGVTSDSGEVHIAVVDAGEGIPLEARERIFERFYRGDRARSRETGGSGLGLSIVKHVTADHGGRIKLWSQQGKGSTFTMILPEAFLSTSGDMSASTPEDLPDAVAIMGEKVGAIDGEKR